MLKAQVNILELEKPSNQVAELSILKNSDQEMLSLKRVMTEQERVQKQFELKVSHLNDLLIKEMDKSKLLENQLAENLKRVRMLTTGTKTLDHLLTVGQCSTSSWGFGFQGSASKSAETVFLKDESEGEDDQTREHHVDLDKAKLHKNHSVADVIGLMSTLRDSSAWSETLMKKQNFGYYVCRVGETDPQDVYTVFPDHTYDCAIGAKYEWEAISVALFWMLKASLNLVSVLRDGTCGLNDSANLKCHTLSLLPAHSISLFLSSDMQPARRSSRLSKLKNVESDPPCVSETTLMNTSDIPSASCPSSRKRVRRRVSAGDTAPPPEHIEPEAESLSDEESSDDNPDEAPVAADTPENRSKEQRYAENQNVYQNKPQFYPELMRPQRMPMTGKFFSMAATERYKDLRGRKFIPQQCISLTDDNLSDVKRIVTGSVVYVRGSLVDFSPSLINSLYCIPGFEEYPNWMEESIDEVCGFLTDGRIRRWENMSSKYLTATNQVLYKLVCSNWIPTILYTSMNQKRLRKHYDREDSLHHVSYLDSAVGETDPQDVYTVFPDHTYDCAIGAKYELEAISVALFWTLKASLSMSSGGLFKIRFLLRDVLLTRS
ncbi:hypothetical protein DY000_02023848 [Brassica cretica]|uniref:Uncharacterized protein n=1 Tax=Brassica cretica TaxID=69181 RepID=A0ABQ7EM53_BRACR|nr:hypothetical protein DY000_02023848 [Brassica cretica]